MLIQMPNQSLLHADAGQIHIDPAFRENLPYLLAELLAVNHEDDPVSLAVCHLRNMGGYDGLSASAWKHYADALESFLNRISCV
jgi:hypothetical protein